MEFDTWCSLAVTFLEPSCRLGVQLPKWPLNTLHARVTCISRSFTHYSC